MKKFISYKLNPIVRLKIIDAVLPMETKGEAIISIVPKEGPCCVWRFDTKDECAETFIKIRDKISECLSESSESDSKSKGEFGVLHFSHFNRENVPIRSLDDLLYIAQRERCTLVIKRSANFKNAFDLTLDEEKL